MHIIHLKQASYSITRATVAVSPFDDRHNFLLRFDLFLRHPRAIISVFVVVQGSSSGSGLFDILHAFRAGPRRYSRVVLTATLDPPPACSRGSKCSPAVPLRDL
jgi:hypothetical protein